MPRKKTTADPTLFTEDRKVLLGDSVDWSAYPENGDDFLSEEHEVATNRNYTEDPENYPVPVSGQAPPTDQVE